MSSVSAPTRTARLDNFVWWHRLRRHEIERGGEWWSGWNSGWLALVLHCQKCNVEWHWTKALHGLEFKFGYLRAEPERWKPLEATSGSRSELTTQPSWCVLCNAVTLADVDRRCRLRATTIS